MAWHTHPSESNKSSVGLRLMAVLLVFTTALNLFLPLLMPTLSTGEHQHQAVKTYSYKGIDHPRELPIPPLKPVSVTVEDSINFQLDSDEGVEQWRAIIPPGGGYVELGPERRRFRLSMFHAIDCLDTIRQNVVERHADHSIPTSEGARFCLNYIRQMVLCRSDIQLEQVRSEYGGKSVQPFVDHNNCRDWTAVYREVERLNSGESTHLDLGHDQ